MDLFVRNFIVFFAYLIGILLILIGFDKFFFKRNKNYGLFGLTVFLVFNLTNCSLSQKNEDNNFKKKDLQLNFSDKIEKLNKKSEWQEFKKFWIKLDAIKPTYSEFDNSYSYKNLNFQIVDEDLKTNFENSLEEHLNILEKKNILQSSEIEILRIICNERINFLFSSNSALLISHIAPPQIEINKINSLNNLEMKIDTLIRLQHYELIDENEFQTAINQINNQIYNLITISTIIENTKEKIYSSGNFADTNSVEKNIEYFENYYNKLKENNLFDENAENQYLRTKEKIVEYKTEFENISEILEDLLFQPIYENDEFPKEFYELKDLWKKLDEIEPIEENNQLTYNIHDSELYFEREEYKTELYKIIEKLKKDDFFNEIEIELINNLILSRINTLQGPNFYTRAIIYEQFSLDDVKDFEFQIDTLNSLKEKNLIDTKEYFDAIQNIFNLTDEILFKSIIFTNFYGISFNDFDEFSQDIDWKNKYIDNRYSKIKQSLEKQNQSIEELNSRYKQLKSKMREVDENLPKIHKIIEIFEQ